MAAKNAKFGNHWRVMADTLAGRDTEGQLIQHLTQVTDGGKTIGLRLRPMKDGSLVDPTDHSVAISLLWPTATGAVREIQTRIALPWVSGDGRFIFWSNRERQFVETWTNDTLEAAQRDWLDLADVLTQCRDNEAKAGIERRMDQAILAAEAAPSSASRRMTPSESLRPLLEEAVGKMMALRGCPNATEVARRLETAIRDWTGKWCELIPSRMGASWNCYETRFWIHPRIEREDAWRDRVLPRVWLLHEALGHAPAKTQNGNSIWSGLRAARRVNREDQPDANGIQPFYAMVVPTHAVENPHRAYFLHRNWAGSIPFTATGADDRSFAWRDTAFPVVSSVPAIADLARFRRPVLLCVMDTDFVGHTSPEDGKFAQSDAVAVFDSARDYLAADLETSETMSLEKFQADRDRLCALDAEVVMRGGERWRVTAPPAPGEPDDFFTAVVPNLPIERVGMDGGGQSATARFAGRLTVRIRRESAPDDAKFVGTGWKGMGWLVPKEWQLFAAMPGFGPDAIVPIDMNMSARTVIAKNIGGMLMTELAASLSALHRQAPTVIDAFAPADAIVAPERSEVFTAADADGKTFLDRKKKDPHVPVPEMTRHADLLQGWLDDAAAFGMPGCRTMIYRLADPTEQGHTHRVFRLDGMEAGESVQVVPVGIAVVGVSRVGRMNHTRQTDPSCYTHADRTAGIAVSWFHEAAFRLVERVLPESVCQRVAEYAETLDELVDRGLAILPRPFRKPTRHAGAMVEDGTYGEDGMEAFDAYDPGGYDA